MHKIDFHDSCDKFELLVSSSIDDELNFQEQAQLGIHFQACESCRASHDSFMNLNELVAQLGLAGSELPAEATVTRPLPRHASEKSCPTPRIGVTRMLMRVVPAAIAATVILGLFALNEPGKSEATATKLQAAEIAAPLVSVAELNSQRVRDQQALVETLDLELRAMKLEIASIKDTEKSKSLAVQIDALLEKIKLLEINEPKINEPKIL